MPPTKLTTFEKFEYFMDQTNKKLDELKDDISEVRKDISELKGLRMALIGASTLASIVSTALFNLALIWVTYKH